MSDAIKNTRHIYDLVELCACKGVRHAVLCPGSRCAPLLIGFGKHAQIKSLSVTDERSAGFIGLGLAQQTNAPVVLVCTSGTAGQNFAPAVTEAFYQNTALIVLTADRPPEWIDQWDGQTIHQQTLYGDHLRARLDFQAGMDAMRQAETVLDRAILPVAGPVHLNIPIHKPFYPQGLDEVRFPALDAAPPSRPAEEIPESDWAALEAILQTAERVLIVAGQQQPDEKLLSLIARLDLPLLGDVTSNIHPHAEAIQSAALFFDSNDGSLQPDFLITIGRSVISEDLKQHFRRHKPMHHWHIGKGMVGNPFQSLSQIVPAGPCGFFQAWLERSLKLREQCAWQGQLKQRDRQLRTHLSNALQCDSLNQFVAIKMILDALPACKNALHLGNSMPVRVANMVGLDRPEPEVWSNRGTCGIEGALSTAVGHALAQPGQLHTLIIGDLAFFYDRNGLWLNQALPANLKIIVMNNRGGGIFRLLPGPSDQSELFDLFATPHQRSVELAASEFSLNYFRADSLPELKNILPSFLALPKSAVLEIPICTNEDERMFYRIKQRPKNELETD